MPASTADTAPSRSTALRRRSRETVVRRSLFHPVPFRREAATHEPTRQESEDESRTVSEFQRTL